MAGQKSHDEIRAMPLPSTEQGRLNAWYAANNHWRVIRQLTQVLRSTCTLHEK